MQEQTEQPKSELPHLTSASSEDLPPATAKSAHTPGPWTLETVATSCGTCHKIGPFPSNSGIHPATHACVYADNVRLADYGRSKTGDELLANARLIAAAPDLLAACQLFAAYQAAIDSDDPATSRPLEAYSTAMDAAFAAIAKATGVKA